MSRVRIILGFAPTATLLASSLMLAACGGDMGAARPQPPSAAGWAGQEQVKQAIALLNQGKAPEARDILIKLLKKEPGDAVARKLIKQIDTPPEQLLGSESYTRTAVEGDSFSSLAEHYLGDPLMAYALARYSGVDVPEALRPGQTLRIPGKEPVVRTAKPAEKPQAAISSSAPAPAKPRPTAPKIATNPAKASQLRARGLEQLNRGVINSAVMLLSQASQLDPQNPLIARDLSRARRIQKTLKQP